MVSIYDIFDGVLLSDGSIRPTANSARFHIPQAGTEHMDWLDLIYDILYALGVDLDKPTIETTNFQGEPYVYSYLRTRTSTFLYEQYRRWYPMGIKIIPEDLCLTPVVLAHWFIGDGSSNWYQRKPTHKKYVYAYLHTYGYTKEEVLRLKRMLAELGMPRWTTYNKANGLGLQLSEQNNVNTLMEMIQPFIVPSYEYKIKMPIKILRSEIPA
jgi:hypothetical protein